MNDDMPRPALDAKLELLETRMDARVAAIESKIDAFLASQSARDSAQGIRNSGFETAIHRLERSTAELKASLNTLKTTMIDTAISTVLAIVFGIASFNSALTSNMLAAFQAGRSSAGVEQRERPSPAQSPPAQAPSSAQ